MHYDTPPDAVQDQFLLGDRVLVAPVLEKGAVRREVWLPPGTWTHWLTGHEYEGGRSVVVDAPLAVTPMFVRDGTALFVAEPGRNAEETLGGPLSLEVYPPSSGSIGAGSLFLDDGESDSASRFVLDVIMRDAGRSLRLVLERRVDSFAPQQRYLELRVPQAYQSVVVDGVRVKLRCDADGPTGRPRSMASARVPLGTVEIVCELR
jgi:hypothetical protein